MGGKASSTPRTEPPGPRGRSPFSNCLDAPSLDPQGPLPGLLSGGVPLVGVDVSGSPSRSRRSCSTYPNWRSRFLNSALGQRRDQLNSASPGRWLSVSAGRRMLRIDVPSPFVLSALFHLSSDAVA